MSTKVLKSAETLHKKETIEDSSLKFGPDTLDSDLLSSDENLLLDSTFSTQLDETESESVNSNQYDVEKSSFYGAEVVKLANKDKQQIPVLIIADGECFEKTFRYRDFTKLPDENKVFIGLGLVHSRAYTCFDTDEKRFEHVLKLFNKGKNPDEVEESRDKIEKIIGLGVEQGYIHVNGKGPELTAKGVKKLKPTKNVTSNEKEKKSEKTHQIDLGDDELLAKISQKQPFSIDNIELKGKFPARQYKFLKMLIEEAKGQIKSENCLPYAVRELTSNATLAEDSTRIAKQLHELELIKDKSERKKTNIEVTGEGITLFGVLSTDEENLVNQSSRHELGVRGEKTIATLDLLSRGEFEIEENSANWLFGKNSQGEVMDRIHREAGGSKESISRLVYRLVEHGLVEVLKSKNGANSDRMITNARLTKKGREYWEKINSEDTE